MTHRITKVSNQDIEYPVTLDDAKGHLNLTADVHDPMLTQYVAAAVEWSEEVTHRAIVQRDYLIVRDKFPTSFWRLPLGYIDSITSVTYLDDDGVEQTWGASNYTLDNASDSAATVRPVPTTTWPSIGQYPASARITVTAGWAVGDVPWSLRMAILQRVSQLFEARGPGDLEAETMEKATRMMLAPWVLPIWA